MRGLKGKRVLITGGAQGIGAATALRFLEEDARVVVLDRDEVTLKQFAHEHPALSGALCADVSDVEAVAQAFEELDDLWGGLDVLINNAGIGYQGALAGTTIDTWRRLIDINLMGPIYHIYAFLPSMKERHSGHIVNVSSGQAFFKLPAWGAYAAVKAALGVMSETLGYELRRYGIRVTTVYPFLVRTSFYDKIEARSFGARLSMKLLPYTADAPEKVARLIFRAVCRGKRVEKISFINELGRWAQMLPGLPQAISILADALLTEKE